MSRCLSCSQENCGYKNCACTCHAERKHPAVTDTTPALDTCVCGKARFADVSTVSVLLADGRWHGRKTCRMAPAVQRRFTVEVEIEASPVLEIGAVRDFFVDRTKGHKVTVLGVKEKT